jgi:hypothetical protein
MNAKEKRKRTWRIKRVQKMAETVEHLRPVAHAGLARGNKVKRPVESGNRSHYLMARIARDRPDVLERAKAGEFISIRQAAIAAGIIREEKSRGNGRRRRLDTQCDCVMPYEE